MRSNNDVSISPLLGYLSVPPIPTYLSHLIHLFLPIIYIWVSINRYEKEKISDV